MKNPIVVLTDTEWMGFLRKYWLAIVLNSPLVVGYVVGLYMGITYVSMPMQIGGVVLVVIVLSVVLLNVAALLNAGIMDDAGYWEDRGIRIQSEHNKELNDDKSYCGTYRY